MVAVSPVYETEPVGGPEPGPLPQRGGRAAHRRRAPTSSSSAAGRLEADAGRVRTVRFGPRTLDADVLLVGDERVDEPDLVVPHPRMGERRFVLAPLADLAPDLVDAGRPGRRCWRGQARGYTVSVTTTPDR